MKSRQVDRVEEGAVPLLWQEAAGSGMGPFSNEAGVPKGAPYLRRRRAALEVQNGLHVFQQDCCGLYDLRNVDAPSPQFRPVVLPAARGAGGRAGPRWAGRTPDQEADIQRVKRAPLLRLHEIDLRGRWSVQSVEVEDVNLIVVVVHCGEGPEPAQSGCDAKAAHARKQLDRCGRRHQRRRLDKADEAWKAVVEDEAIPRREPPAFRKGPCT